MATSSTPRPPRASRFIEPGLRPSEADLPRKRLIAGLLCCIGGFISTALGGSSALGQCLLVAGGLLFLIGLFLLGTFRPGLQSRSGERDDPRKLYGRPKA